MTAQVAIKATLGLDVDMSGYLQTAKDGTVVETLERALDEKVLLRAVNGDLNAGADIQREVWDSYKTLKQFMDKEGRNLDFLEKMRRIGDGKGGIVWVRTENVQRWQEKLSAGAASS